MAKKRAKSEPSADEPVIHLSGPVIDLMIELAVLLGEIERSEAGQLPESKPTKQPKRGKKS